MRSVRREYDGRRDAAPRAERELGTGRRLDERPPGVRAHAGDVDAVAGRDHVADLKRRAGSWPAGVDADDLVHALVDGHARLRILELKAEHADRLAGLEPRGHDPEVAEVDRAGPAHVAQLVEAPGISGLHVVRGRAD